MPEIIPVSATVHYKAAFDIQADVPELMTYIRQAVRQWCIRKTQCADDLLHRKWFLAGNNPKVEPPQYLVNVHQLRTAVAQSTDPKEPNYWALELVHPDADEMHRRWSVDVVLRRVDSSQVVFTTVVRNWIVANFIGEYPAPPSPSVPAYVSALVADRALRCSKGTSDLKSHFTLVQSAHTQSFYDALKAEERYVPFVVMSHHGPSAGPLLDPARLSVALVGNANVYVLASEAVNDELNYHLGAPYHLAPGMVRVFFPGLDKTNPYEPRRHRYLAESDILECGSDTILGYLTNGLCRNSSAFRLKDLTCFGDVLAERRRQRIATLSAERLTRASEKSESSADTELLYEEIEVQSRAASDWETQAIQLDNELSVLKRENGNLNIRVVEADRVRNQIKDLTAQLAGLRNFTTLPSQLDEVLQAFGRLYPERLAVSDDAIAAASRYGDEQKQVFGKPEGLKVAWEMVHSLAVTLHRLVFDDHVANLEKAFNSEVPDFELALTETGKTKKDSDLMSLRRFEWNGQTLDMTPHIKFGNRQPRMLRLHFAIDNINRLFIVGHFGDHLDTSSTRRMS